MMRKLFFTAALCSIPPVVAAAAAAAAAARQHGAVSSSAFVVPQPQPQQPSSSYSTCCRQPQPQPLKQQEKRDLIVPSYLTQSSSRSSSSTRHFASLFDNRNRNKKDDEGNFIAKAIGKAKEVGSKYLPAIFGPPSKETQREMRIEKQKREARKEVDETVGALFKDAPLGMRMVGKLMKPLISTVAQIFSEQTQSIQEVLDDAESYILNDAIVSQTLGGRPIRVSAPFSQSSSTTIINGRQTSQIQASFQVVGQRTTGIATLVAANGDIRSLQIDIGGRMYNVNTSGVTASTDSSSSYGPTSKLGKNTNINRDDVIDAEFVEKK